MAKSINGTNQFNSKSLKEMQEALESGETITIYIDCIGHTRAYLEERAYARELKKAYGDKLVVEEGHDTKYRLKSKKICYVTTMTEMPKNCVECKLELCTIPCWDNNNARIKKAYTTKRPKDCPLIEVEV